MSTQCVLFEFRGRIISLLFPRFDRRFRHMGCFPCGWKSSYEPDEHRGEVVCNWHRSTGTRYCRWPEYARSIRR